LGRRGAVGDDPRVAPELDSAAFPDDAVRMRALLAERDAALAERDAALAERDAARAERDADRLSARLEIEKLKCSSQRSGATATARSSERLAAEIGQLEMLIGDLEEDAAEREAAARRRSAGPRADRTSRASPPCAAPCPRTCRARRCCMSLSSPAAAAAPTPPA
jgi:septal ring factor EnvC (AmiA/AmiB activator)